MQDRTAEDDLAFAATGPLSALASATYWASRVNWTTQSGSAIWVCRRSEHWEAPTSPCGPAPWAKRTFFCAEGLEALRMHRLPVVLWAGFLGQMFLSFRANLTTE